MSTGIWRLHLLSQLFFCNLAFPVLREHVKHCRCLLVHRYFGIACMAGNIKKKSDLRGDLTFLKNSKGLERKILLVETDKKFKEITLLEDERTNIDLPETSHFHRRAKDKVRSWPYVDYCLLVVANVGHNSYHAQG